EPSEPGDAIALASRETKMTGLESRDRSLVTTTAREEEVVAMYPAKERLQVRFGPGRGRMVFSGATSEQPAMWLFERGQYEMAHERQVHKGCPVHWHPEPEGPVCVACESVPKLRVVA